MRCVNGFRIDVEALPNSTRVLELSARGRLRPDLGRVPAVDCDIVPTDVETTDYSLPFEVPSGLMPDPQFDGMPAQLEVHRVRPVYAE